MFLEQLESGCLELVMAAGEQGGAGKAGGAQVAEDVLGSPGAGDGEPVLGHFAERRVGQVVLVEAAWPGVRATGARAPVFAE